MSRCELDPEKLFIEQTFLEMMGVTQFTCWSRECQSPVGLAWTRRYGVSSEPGNSPLRRTDLLYILTLPNFQRCGITRALHEAIFADGADVIHTGEGSRTGGLAILKAFGYRLSGKAGLWVLKREWFDAAPASREAGGKEEEPQPQGLSEETKATPTLIEVIADVDAKVQTVLGEMRQKYGRAMMKKLDREITQEV